MMRYLRANGSNTLVYLWIFFKLATHGCVVFFEICMSEFANSGEDQNTQCESKNQDEFCDDFLYKNEEIRSSFTL